jgi:hypothetical protein
MKLTFQAAHISIKAFPTIELPPFTVLTGLNGAGKSHFLDALQTGHIRADCAPDPQKHITSFNWTNMVPGDPGQFDGQTLVQERTQIWSALEQARQQFVLGRYHGQSPDSLVSQVIRATGLSEALAAEPLKTAQLDERALMTCR